MSLHINFHVPMDELHESLQRSINMVSFGAQASEKIAQFTSASVPGAGVVLQIGAGLPDLPEVKSDFLGWLMLSGFRDALERFMKFTETIREIQFALITPRTNQQEWDNAVAREKRRFHLLNFPDKLDKLADDGIASDPDLDRCARSINIARNCLTHRLSIVGAHDTGTDGFLRVQWRTIVLVAMLSDGATRPVQQPGPLNEGEGLGVMAREFERAFSVGDTLEFTPNEFLGVCTSLFLFGQNIVQGAEDLARKLGVQPIGGRI